MIFPNISRYLSRVFYGWRMIGLVSAFALSAAGCTTLCHIGPAFAVLPLIAHASRWQLWLFTIIYTRLDA